MLTRAVWLALTLTASSAAAVPIMTQEASYEYQERVIVERAVDEVMSRPEFRRLADAEDGGGGNPAWLDRFLDWIEDWLARSHEGETPAVGSGAGYLMYGLAFAIVLAALAFIIKSVLESAREQQLADERARARILPADAAPGETPPDEFWKRAQELAADGKPRLAIRELLLGAMSTLERRGRIRYRRGLTNRDYVWAASGRARISLRTIVNEFERVYFGRRAATADGFRECADAYRESFGVEAEAESA